MPANVAFFAPAALANHPSQCGGAMTREKKAAAHTYSVTLRFTGERLEPSEISARLNLQPSYVLSQSQNQSPTRKRHPFWAYDGRGEAGYQLEWTCLEDGLEFLLKNLSSRKAEIIALARQFDAVWWCGHFQTSFDGGPTLSPKLLTEMGAYGIPLSIDNYFADE
jgi:hypothetical protein